MSTTYLGGFAGLGVPVGTAAGGCSVACSNNAPPPPRVLGEFCAFNPGHPPRTPTRRRTGTRAFCQPPTLLTTRAIMRGVWGYWRPEGLAVPDPTSRSHPAAPLDQTRSCSRVHP